MRRFLFFAFLAVGFISPSWLFGPGVTAIAAPESTDDFKDCPECPEMVVVPPGSFMMGSPASEESRGKWEGPQHRVTISSAFAVGKFEVTFAEWDACVAAGGCDGYRPRDEGWGRDRRPVIYVTWKAAKAYVTWLSRHTGKQYRLLNESEWEYAARAGTTTPFSTGPTITTDQANFNGNFAYEGSSKGVYWEKTLPVGSFSSNAFGLYDMHGNVSEWVEDCWHNTYAEAPGDGAAWTSGGDCSSQRPMRVNRGGSWYYSPGSLRSAFRGREDTGYRSRIFGFRVARTLDH
jgi:formylglycine-generating enzyme required for sulfatase activity